MELLPFVFCESVIATFQKPSAVAEPLSSPVWQVAIDKNVNNRFNVYIFIAYHNETWSYRINNGLTIADLGRVRRKYLRVGAIHLESFQRRNNSTFEEILLLVQLTAPYMSMSTLAFTGICNFPQDRLLQLLSFIRNSSIFEIYVNGDIEPVRSSVKDILNFKTLQNATFYNANFSASFRDEIEELALTKSLELLAFEPLNSKFNLTFFEKLFAKPKRLLRKGFTLRSFFDFQLIDLRDFKKELQINESTDSMIKWKRADGIVIQIKISLWGTLAIELEPAEML